jgi:2'-5' RNA ligase
MSRLFVALKIPENIKDLIIEYRNTIWKDSTGLRWESKEKLHLTLKFIGEVEQSSIKEISDALTFVEDFDKINLSLGQFGFFYNRESPRILWIGLNYEPVIYDLVNRINYELEKFSIPKEKKKFKAHLTLLRIKRTPDESFIKAFNNFKVPELKFVSTEAAIIESTLLPAGSRYKDLKEYKLK